MKKLLLILLLAPALLKAQCITKKDAFTGKEIKSGITFLIAAIPGSPVFGFGKNGDDPAALAFSFTVDLKPSSFDTQKMLLMIKFVSGDVKKFHANKQTTVIAQTNNVIVGFAADITPEDISYFQLNQIAAIRLCYTGDESVGYDTEISEGKAKKIIKSVACIL